MNDWAIASAPATTANLGPAFDCMALALRPRCTVRARRSEEWSVEHEGEFKPAGDEPDGVLAAARKAVGERPLTISVSTEIPLGKGLGSSAAAYVAGAAAALRAVGEDALPDRVFRIAADLDHHADQAGAAVYGGLVVIPAEGLPMRVPLHPSLRPVLGIPETRLSTSMARSVLADDIRREVVVRSLSRVASLTAGLLTGDPGMLAAAHGDEIHEAPRAPLNPVVGELMETARRAGALHVARSGSGPSVLAIVTAETAERVAAAFEAAGAIAINEPMDTVGLI